MKPQVKVIPPSGILDGVSGAQLRREIDAAIKEGHYVILIDCSNVDFMDSSGLGSLVMGLRQTRAIGGRFVLCSINDQIKLLLELTDMESTFEIFESPEVFYLTTTVESFWAMN